MSSDEPTNIQVRRTSNPPQDPTTIYSKQNQAVGKD